MKRILLLTTTSMLFCVAMLHAQNVFNPADPIVRYNSAAALGSSTNPNPTFGGLQKWVSVASNGISTGSGSYDVTSYKAYYINVGGAGMSFRLKFPKSYTNPDSAGKKYPLMLFFHGAGEPGCNTNGGVYNNERQLTHGGKYFRDNVDNGKFDGFLFYPQVNSGASCSGNWGAPPYSYYFDLIVRALDSLTKYSRFDADKLFVDGLSNGGAAVWSMASYYPQRVARIAPSSAITGSTNYNDFIHIPIWFAAGAKDTNPTETLSTGLYNNIKNLGADIKFTLYPNDGHGIWNKHWAEPGYLEFMAATNKTNPLVYFQRYEWCPDAAISAKIGVTAGFNAYEWQKDGVTIATRTGSTNTIIDGSSIISYTGNEVTVKSFGTYRVRFRRTASGAWSEWSAVPAVIKSKPITQTPDIQINGSFSKVLPSPDGSSTVSLKLPDGYATYQWLQGATQVGTQSTFTAQAGTYTAKVVEQYGCGALPSAPFTVINANGSPKPEPAKNLVAAPTSLTSIQLDWSDNPNAGVNETGFEIYRATTAGGPYQFVAVTAPNATTYNNAGLTTNTQYYFIVRAVGASGAAIVSNEAGAKTAVDNTGPTAPGAFKVNYTGSSYANVQWTGSTDDVGVDKYDIFVNGVKTYSTTETTFTVANLDSGQVYAIYVKARDAVGNYSVPSNQLTVTTGVGGPNGINYKYYQGTWTSIPDFNSLAPIKVGVSATADIAVRNQSDNFGFLWQGYLNVPTTANYTFEICSDAGSELYIDNGFAPGVTPTIDHDGLHSNTCKTGTLSLTAGMHPIALAYFETTGSQSMTFSWQSSGAGINKQTVPASVLFTTGQVAPNIAAPSHLTATATAYNKIQLNWTDNSNNETGFEVLRSTSVAGTYTQVTTVAGTSYVDSGLTANTKYFYKVRAVGNGGESVYESNFAEVNWKANNSGADEYGSGTRTLALTGATYSNAQVKEGSHAITFSGTNQYVTVNNSSTGGFPSDGGFTQRTVALWIRPTSTSNNKMIFDFGNSTNGLALRFTGGNLQAGIASGSSRFTATSTTLTSNVNWLGLNNWNHVAVVYDVNSLKLYLNGVLVATNTGTIAFTAMGAAVSNASRLGYSSGTNGSDNAFNSGNGSSDYFAGQMDDIHVINGALTAAEISSLSTSFTFTSSSATTEPLPAAPATPTSLVATAVSGTTVNLTWTDAATTETGYEIWRSDANNSNYRLVTKIAAVAGSGIQAAFSDTTLFANVTYYYKVRGTGVSAPSAYSTEVSVVTPNTIPAFAALSDFSIKYNTVHNLAIQANDPDGDPLQFTTENLPYFSTLQDLGNGLVNIVSTPSIADQGSYAVTIYVSDEFGGKDTLNYTMIVNNNNLPVITAIANVSMNEGESRNVAVVATDVDGNGSLSWSVENKPSFATLVDNGNGSATVTLLPNMTAAGTYTMTVKAEDGSGGWTNKSFTINVADKDPNETIQVNMKYQTNGGDGWNDIETASGAAFNVANLKNTKGVATSVGINLQSGTYGSSDAGTQGGNVLPNTVMKDGIFWGFSWQGGASADNLVMRVRGLDVSKKYNFVFMGSNNCGFCGLNSNSTTTYTIGTESVAIKYYNNTSITDTIYQVQPAANGEVIITMTGDTDPGVGGSLVALVIDAKYDDGSTPAKPTHLAAEGVPGEGVQLTWTDVAFNESNYKVFRSATQAGPYSLVTTLAGETSSFLDGSVAPYTQYYYYVMGTNQYGDGASSDTVVITTANNKPVIAGLVSSFVLKTDANIQDDFTITDTPGDIVTVTVDNKPSYVTLQPMGGNNYRLIVAPTASDLGSASFTVKAVDDKGAVVTTNIAVSITDKNTRSVFVNFTNWGDEAPAPWNNIVGYGAAGTTLGSLRDESNATTPFSIQLVNGWSGLSLTGHMTGNNSGAFPDLVMKSGWWDNNTAARTIRFSGLDNSKRYNVIIVGTQNEGIDALARYSSGSSSDTLNAKYNTQLTGNVNNLTPVGGVINVDLTKLSTATYQFVTGVQLEEFTAGINLNPVNMYAEPTGRTGIAVSWSDRTNNEDAVGGFQLQRATDAGFANVTTFDLPSNTVTHNSTGLAPNTKYWFRVRAKVLGVFTDWSNVAKAITPNNISYVNLNFATEFNAQAPWFNLAALPTNLFSFTGINNQANQPTGLGIEITKPMNGDNNFGVITGNNSGIAPDVVLQSNFWIDNTQESQMKLSGLNQAKRYRIGFLGSMSTNGWFAGNYTCTYTIGNRTVYLNSWMNSTKIVYIGDVKADANGEVMLNFSTTLEAVYGFNGGIIIQSYDDVPEGGSQLNGSPSNGFVSGTTTEDATARVATQVAVAQEVVTEGRMYPNPFIDQVSLDFNNTAADNNVSVDVYDLGGRLVFRKAFGKLAAGYNTLRVNTGTNLGTGVYMITLNVNGKPVQVSKMVKANQ
jgi:pimeloyl-ACP methyl ester carboxylesterase